MFRSNVDSFIMWIFSFTIEIKKPISTFGPKFWFCDDLHVSTSYWSFSLLSTLEQITQCTWCTLPMLSTIIFFPRKVCNPLILETLHTFMIMFLFFIIGVKLKRSFRCVARYCKTFDPKSTRVCMSRIRKMNIGT